MERPGAEHCFNCGEKVSGTYCSNCGQKNVDYRESIWSLISELAEEVISFDSRIYRSLLLLVGRPGRLTREYNEGRRARYIRPLRMYLSSSIIYFFVLSLRGPFIFLGDAIRDKPLETPESSAAGAAGQVETAPAEGKAVEGVQTPAAEVPGQKSGIFLEPLTGGLSDSTPRIVVLGMGEEGWDSIIERWKAERGDTTAVSIGSIVKDYAVKQYEKLRGMPRPDLEKNFVAGFQKNLPTMMFFLLPIFALILKLIYPMSKRFYIEHVIFSLHFHSFVFLILTILLLVDRPVLYQVAPIAILFYLFLAMKRVYLQSFLGTLGKFFALIFGYLIALAVTFLLTVAATFVFL